MKRSIDTSETAPNKLKVRREDESVTSLLEKYREEWGLSEDQIKSCVSLIELDGVSLLMKNDKLRLFLYAKGILDTKSSLLRKSEFEDLLEGKTGDLRKALERLKIIVDKRETTPIRGTIEPTTMFESFVQAHPEWKEGKDVFVIHRDHPDLRGKEHALVERLQLSGLCYMHAPIVLQHYLVAMTNSGIVPMLDMPKYLRSKLSAGSLYRHIWDDEGGDSYNFLKHILSVYPKKNTRSSRNDEILAKNLHEFGPALVSGFQVTNNFASNEEWQYLDKFEDKIIGLHAMVLIGYRSLGDDKRYLLQNWWHKKAYVEVDLKYLFESEAHIHFIQEKQHMMGNFAQSYEPLVECESGMDAAERFLPERQIVL